MINQIQQMFSVRGPSKGQVARALQKDGMRGICRGCYNERRLRRTDTKKCRVCTDQLTDTKAA